MKILNVTDTRKFWQSKGKLYTCPNPTHNFKLGRLLGYWQIAKDGWSNIDSSGSLQNYLFHVGTVENLNGTKGYKLVIWKLILLIGITQSY